jgi:hypothetical protein
MRTVDDSHDSGGEMRVDRLRYRLVSLSCIALLLSGCATHIARRETPRAAAVPPSPNLASAVADYKARDPDASFTFVGGQVDGFATSAKAQVPDYALTVLSQVGLSVTARPVTKLLTPIQGPPRTRNLDTSDRALPFVNERSDATSPGVGTTDATDSKADGRTLPVESRTQSSPDSDRMIEWARPDSRTLELELLGETDRTEKRMWVVGLEWFDTK